MMLTCRTYSGAEARAMGSPISASTDATYESDLEALIREILANSLVQPSRQQETADRHRRPARRRRPRA